MLDRKSSCVSAIATPWFVETRRRVGWARLFLMNRQRNHRVTGIQWLRSAGGFELQVSRAVIKVTSYSSLSFGNRAITINRIRPLVLQRTFVVEPLYSCWDRFKVHAVHWRKSSLQISASCSKNTIAKKRRKRWAVTIKYLSYCPWNWIARASKSVLICFKYFSSLFPEKYDNSFLKQILHFLMAIFFEQ